jgi:ABC-type dipeptide/oligopeptide/nickel transport system permease subunit
VDQGEGEPDRQRCRGPATVIVLTTLSISLLGDWLRDKLDPTLR